jgi:hypothetical protein
VPALRIALHAEQRKSNILFILADNLGASDPHCFGSTYHEAPNIDALAAHGVKLTQSNAAVVFGRNCRQFATLRQLPFRQWLS